MGAQILALRSHATWAALAAGAATIPLLLNPNVATGVALSIFALVIAAILVDLIAHRDLFAPTVLFPIAYVAYYLLGSWNGLFGNVPPRLLLLEALGLAGYLIGVSLVGVLVHRPIIRWPRRPNALAMPPAPVRLRLDLAVVGCIGIALLAAGMIFATLGGTPLANLGQRHGLSAYLFELVELGWLAALWWNFDHWARDRRVSKRGILLLGGVAALLAALAYRTPLLMMILIAAMGYHRLVRAVRPVRLVVLVLVLMLFAGVYGWWRLAHSPRYGGYTQYKALTSLKWSPLEPIAPLAATVREGSVVLALLTENIPARYDFQHGAVTFSTIQTLLPGWQRGPREWIGIYARGNEHSTTPSILGFLYVDFGIPGIFFGMMLFGVGIAALWQLVEQRPSLLTLWLWAYFNAALLLSIHTGFADLRHLVLTLFAVALAWIIDPRLGTSVQTRAA